MAAIPIPSAGQPILQTWGKSVADKLNSSAGQVVGTVDYGAVESGEIGATNVLVRAAPGAVLVAGHVYRIDLIGSVVNRTGTGGAGALASLQIVATGTTTPVLAYANSHEVFLHAANIVKPADMSGFYVAPTNQTVDILYYLAKAWWSGNNVRFIVGTGTPGAIFVTDLGPKLP